MQEQLSPLAQALAQLIESRVVVSSPMPLQNAFPTARIVVPVYDSNGTGGAPANTHMQGNNAQLARRP